MLIGTVFDISRYAIHDGPGIRTTVFFKGCPLSCWWCHNPESIAPEPELSMRPARCIRCGSCIEACPNGAISLTRDGVVTDASLCRLCRECADACPAEAREVAGRTMTVGQVMVEIEKDIPFYDESGGGVTLSGGEPLLQPDFLLGLLEACGRRGIHRAVDTSGYCGKEILLQAAEVAELFLYDLKQMDPEAHRRFTGVGNEPILANLLALAGAGAAVWIRFPLVPGYNDDRDNLTSMGEFLRELGTVGRVDILPYHDSMLGKYRRFGRRCRLEKVPRPDPDSIAEAAGILKAFGLRVTIGGDEYERAHSQAQTGQP